jgi:hypothetical protein
MRRWSLNNDLRDAPFRRLPILALASIMVVAASFPASAEDARPGDWTIGPIHMKSSNGAAYCSMKNTYENGHTLVFARDAAGHNSIAVDAGKDAFRPGAQVFLTLNVGPIRRMATAVAATREVVIAQMGKDEDFYDMLRRKNALQIDLPGKPEVFSLKGTAQALDQLDNCTQQLGGDGAFPTVTVPGSAHVSYDARPFADFAAPSDLPDIPVDDEVMADAGLDRYLAKDADTAADVPVHDEEAAERNDQLEKRARALEIENDRLKRMLLSKQDVPLDVIEKTAKSVAVEDKTGQEQEGALKVTTTYTQGPAPMTDLARRYNGLPQPAVAVPRVDGKSSLYDRVLWAAGAASGKERTDAVSGMKSYLWQSGSVFAKAEERPAQTGVSVQDIAGIYVNEARSRCKNDFAYKLGTPTKQQGVDILSGEIACLGGNESSLAVIAVLARGAESALVAYEGGAEQSANVLSQRDGFLSRVYGEK